MLCYFVTLKSKALKLKSFYFNLIVSIMQNLYLNYKLKVNKMLTSLYIMQYIFRNITFKAGCFVFNVPQKESFYVYLFP